MSAGVGGTTRGRHMGTWILILTLSGNGADGLGPDTNVSSVSGFVSQAACEKAGRDWKRSTSREMRAVHRCVLSDERGKSLN